jgi:hypothetical protein
MNFKEKDSELQRNIINSLHLRWTINSNKEVGKMYLQPEFEDKINPSVTLTREQIKEITGREKLRDVVLDDYAEALSRPGIEVERMDDKLRISVVPIRSKENEFAIEDLMRKNAEELKADPQLGEFPF